MQLSVIIPVFNEEGTIEKILTKVFKQPEVGEIIAVNDGSTDRSFQILKNLSRKNHKLKVFTHNKNLGKGAAIKTGISKATKDFILIQDADLEYNPEEFERLIKVAKKNTSAYGSRMLRKNPHAYPWTYFGNLILTGICNTLFNTHLTDIYTCYKLIPTNILKGLSISSNGFEMEAEITAKLLKNGVDIVEVPISYQPRTYEGGKKIKTKDAIEGIFTLIKIRFFYRKQKKDR